MLALAASPALAQVAHPRDEEACLTVLKDAKAKEQEGALQAARVLLRQCAQNPCSAFVRQQCANRNTKLEMDTPTVVLLVTDAAGGSRTDVQVRGRRRAVRVGSSTGARCRSIPACTTSRSSPTGTCSRRRRS